MIGRRQGSLLRLVGGGLLACLLAASPALGHIPRPGEPGRAERALIARGFDLDTISLVELVRSEPDYGTRMDALSVLSWRPEEEVREPLRELLDSTSDPLVLRELAVALARFGEESAFEILRALMRETASDIDRTYLAATLARFGDLEGYPLLTAALASGSSAARDNARRALFDLAAEDLALEPLVDVPSMLLKALEDAEPWNRRGGLTLVYEAVKEGGFAAELFLVAVKRLASEDPDPKVRERAALTLRWLERPPDPRLDKAFELLRKRLREERERAIELECQRLQEQRERSQEPPP